MLAEYMGFAFDLATVVVPVALYFLILGLLNSRSHPQMLSGKLDFALLIVAMSPLFVLPISAYLGLSMLTVLGLTAALAASIVLLSPPDRMWVVYNIPRDQARHAVTRALVSIGQDVAAAPNEIRLTQSDAAVRISEFSLLKNVTIRLRGADAQLVRQFEQALAKSLASAPAEASPMAVTLLLLSTAMLVAPVTLMAHNMPQIVRLITDLIH